MNENWLFRARATTGRDLLRVIAEPPFCAKIARIITSIKNVPTPPGAGMITLPPIPNDLQKTVDPGYGAGAFLIQFHIKDNAALRRLNSERQRPK
jgi:hypothetical protein